MATKIHPAGTCLDGEESVSPGFRYRQAVGCIQNYKHAVLKSEVLDKSGTAASAMCFWEGTVCFCTFNLSITFS